MSWGTLIDFYIENLSGINDIIELDKRARSTLHEKVAEFLRKSIHDDIKSWDGFPNSASGVELDGNEVYVWWLDSRFYNNEKGTCFYIYLSSSALINPKDEINPRRNDFPVIYVKCEGIGGDRLRNVKEAIDGTRSSMIGTPWPSSKNIMAYKKLTDILNFEYLKDQQKLQDLFLKEAKEFSEKFARVIPDLNR